MAVETTGEIRNAMANLGDFANVRIVGNNPSFVLTLDSAHESANGELVLTVGVCHDQDEQCTECGEVCSGACEECGCCFECCECDMDYDEDEEY